MHRLALIFKSRKILRKGMRQDMYFRQGKAYMTFLLMYNHWEPLSIRIHCIMGLTNIKYLDWLILSSFGHFMKVSRGWAKICLFWPFLSHLGRKMPPGTITLKESHKTSLDSCGNIRHAHTHLPGLAQKSWKYFMSWGWEVSAVLRMPQEEIVAGAAGQPVMKLGVSEVE